MSWHPECWRRRPAAQQPAYPDHIALESVESCLGSAPPLTNPAKSRRLLAKLAEVSAGRSFLLQGGDCAESFAEFGPDKVRRTFNLLIEMGAILRAGGCGEVVELARIAGQFAKSRSSDVEGAGGRVLPAYRGDIVNGAAFDAAARTADPVRMLEAYRQSRVTLDLLDAYSAAAYAGLSPLHRAARHRLALEQEHADPSGNPGEPAEMFTSHELLLLNYEQALARWDEVSECWWSTSAHMLWIGDRTRRLDGAHVEFASGIANPLGLKCGPTMGPDELMRLAERLDRDNRPGRLILIGRFGSREVARRLPALMRATRRAGLNAIWATDPMHGNSRAQGGRKIRLMSEIVSEISSFFDIAASESVRVGGIHLELSGSDIAECVDDRAGAAGARNCGPYLTHCDPRLNRSQSVDVAREVARLRCVFDADGADTSPRSDRGELEKRVARQDHIAS